jgi:hypothetical protein
VLTAPQIIALNDDLATLAARHNVPHDAAVASMLAYASRTLSLGEFASAAQSLINRKARDAQERN